jgi:C-5 cytosine-specific DNA methylase
MKPLAIDLFCGLGGWTEGLLAEGYDVVGFDIERHEYGAHRYPAQLVIQDVLTLHGSQFRDATLIVASPPCQEYSYMEMPWKLAKAKAAAIRADTTGQMLADLNRLFDACFRIQAQASLASGRHVPMIVENVRGATPWVGRARWNFGSYYLWGDVPALMPAGRPIKVQSFRFDGSGRSFQTAAVREGYKSAGMNWSDRSKRGQDFTRIAGQQSSRRTDVGNGVRFTSLDCGVESRWFNDGPRSPDSISSSSSSSPRRKAASAMIAKIPLPLSRHIAAVYRN